MSSRTISAAIGENEEFKDITARNTLRGKRSGKSGKARILEFKRKEGNFDKVIVNQSIGYKTVKRISDIILSLIALIVLSPVFLITAIAVVLEDGAPAIFSQERNGLNGKKFRMYKFRSMCKEAPAMHQEMLAMNELEGPAFKMKDDPRVTKVGHIIRRTSIDELPQLVNIIRGEMSIVGPRPLPVYETEELNSYQSQRLLVKPGLTCYWQVNGRSDVPFDEWMEMDLKYINDASFLTDIKIILKTFGAVLSRKGAN